MMRQKVERIYRDYIDALNERRLEDLDEFVHDRLVYNGQETTREQYAAMLAEDVRVIPDLHYDIDLLVVDGHQLSARLWFACRPRASFLGIAVDGRRIFFAEHVFYRLHEGRIDQVWSLLDKEAIRDQANS